jgi:hypothetical protein
MSRMADFFVGATRSYHCGYCFVAPPRTRPFCSSSLPKHFRHGLLGSAAAERMPSLAASIPTGGSAARAQTAVEPVWTLIRSIAFQNPVRGRLHPLDGRIYVARRERSSARPAEPSGFPVSTVAMKIPLGCRSLRGIIAVASFRRTKTQPPTWARNWPKLDCMHLTQTIR